MEKKEVVYSASLKRMIGFKLFPSFNPESLVTKTSNPKKAQEILRENKTDRQIHKMKQNLREYQNQ